MRAPCRRGSSATSTTTVTRTLLGRGYPGPGLFAKVFDQDFQPLVELVQDTCGRHDNFDARLHGEILRGHGLSGPRQLLGQFQRRARALRRASGGAAGRRSISSTTPGSTTKRALSRRAVVAARRLRAVPCADRPGVRARRPARTTSTPPTAGTRRRSTSAPIRPRSASRARWPFAGLPMQRLR